MSQTSPKYSTTTVVTILGSVDVIKLSDLFFSPLYAILKSCLKLQSLEAAVVWISLRSVPLYKSSS
jgi:hypothetical protein